MAKIMLVEDDNNLREIYGERLSAEGYEIISAHDGEEALALAVKEKPDLIISDIMMPKISGFDMLDILRETPETKDTKIIMMTALSQTENKERADKLGADKYLVKSQVTLEDVAKTVRDMLYPTTSQTTESSAQTDTMSATNSSEQPEQNNQTTDNLSNFYGQQQPINSLTRDTADSQATKASVPSLTNPQNLSNNTDEPDNDTPDTNSTPMMQPAYPNDMDQASDASSAPTSSNDQSSNLPPAQSNIAASEEIVAAEAVPTKQEMEQINSEIDNFVKSNDIGSSNSQDFSAEPISSADSNIGSENRSEPIATPQANNDNQITQIPPEESAPSAGTTSDSIEPASARKKVIEPPAAGDIDRGPDIQELYKEEMAKETSEGANIPANDESNLDISPYVTNPPTTQQSNIVEPNSTDSENKDDDPSKPNIDHISL